jgi:hypothetical protein
VPLTESDERPASSIEMANVEKAVQDFQALSKIHPDAAAAGVMLAMFGRG